MRFGVAGYPPAYTQFAGARDRTGLFPWLANMGLSAVELQMTYGPRTSIQNCKTLRCAADDYGITISVHASYFIVLTSRDRIKIERSIETLKRTFELSEHLGSDVVVLHPGSTYGADASSSLERFVENSEAFFRQMGRSRIGLFVETAGKIGQLGSVAEILELARRVDGVNPCIDFGHVHARSLGGLENPSQISELTNAISDFCGRTGRRVHFHYTPIHFGPRGEIQHRALHDRYPVESGHGVGASSRDGFYHPRAEPVAAALRRSQIKATIISEAHNSQEEGAKALQMHYFRAEE